MKFRLLLCATFFFALARMAAAATPPVELELATERGLQITAPQEWLQLLAGIGINQVRIRGIQMGDEPQVVNRGNSRAPSYRVVGVLTSRNELRLPGGTFSRTDRARLKDYFAHLTADGADAVTAPHLRFGLTGKELRAVLTDLAQPINFETKRQAPRAIVDRLQSKLSFKFGFDTEAERALREAPPVIDEFKDVAAGTAVAIVLRNCGLIFRPEKLRGQPISFHVTAAGADAIGERTLGKMSGKEMQYWPIGWDSGKPPGEIAPALFESRNSEIDGYSLEEALAAIGPRLKMPMFYDRAALAAYKIEPVKIQVKLARTRISYKRVIDRIVAQARLGCEVRVDEAGMPFLWITR